MSRRQLVTVTCDFCGWGGALTRPQDFTQHGSAAYDLCKWCADPEPHRAAETGGHCVTFTETGWTCSCGVSWRRPMFPFGVEAAVPHLPNATAHRHLDNSWRLPS